MNRDHHKTCIRPVGIGRLCGAQATREFCYAAEPWMPYCDEHEPQYATAGERPIRKVGDSTPPATEAEALVRGLEDVRAGRIVPLPPAERKPTTLELSGTMPDVSHYSRCARCGGSGREEDASHPPAVSGEGERMKEQAAAYRAIALNALACWQGEDEHSDDNQRRNRSARSRATLRHRICAVDDTVRASTPTPGAPR